MKKIWLSLVCAAVLGGCKKDEDVNPAGIKIVKTSILINGNTFYLNFEYDTQGRIVKLTRNMNNEAPQTVATVNYTGNEALIEETGVNSSAVSIHSQIKFLLGANGKPQQRIALQTEEYFAPNNPQRSFANDTTFYEYTAGGLLSRTTKLHRDSVWYQPSAGVTNTNMQYSRLVAVFTVSNGNLTAVTGTGTGFFRASNGVATQESNTLIDESINYEYTGSYANKTDFTNAFILEEFEALFTLPYPLNSGYKNLPSKITRQTVTRDAGGNPISANSESVTYTALFNSYGFLSNLNSAAGTGSGLNVKYNK